MRFAGLNFVAIAAFAAALATPTMAQEWQGGDVDLIAIAKEKSRAFTGALWCTAVFRTEGMGFEEARALEELRPLALDLGYDTEDKLLAQIEGTERTIFQGDRYGPPLDYDEIEDLRSECIDRYRDE